MTLRITTLGSKAWQLLKAAETGAVWGITSQGIFIHLPQRGMIFLSFETYRGPLTANLEGDKLLLKALKSSDQAKVADGRLVFSPSDPSLVWEDAETWDAPLGPVDVLPYESLLERYKEIRKRIHALRETSIPPIDLRLDQLEEGLKALLGQGSGLTPAGDDIILGCLLTLKRWGGRFLPGLDIRGLSQELVSTAFSRTTLLSANLIACAAEGQADERLIAALDGIFSGLLEVKDCAALLLAWGDSSGCAALDGMGVAFEQFFGVRSLTGK
jgi:hypothetical protein